MIDQKLSWSEHVKLIKMKILPILATLRRSRYLLPQETRLAIYYSHFHTHLTYIAAVWGSTGVTRLSELGRLQNKAIRYIFWSNYEQFLRSRTP